MNEKLSLDSLKYIIERIMENAKEAKADSQNDNEGEFNLGRKIAYYEVLDILQTELYVRDIDLKAVGLDGELTNLL